MQMKPFPCCSPTVTTHSPPLLHAQALETMPPPAFVGTRNFLWGAMGVNWSLATGGFDSFMTLFFGHDTEPALATDGDLPGLLLDSDGDFPRPPERS